MNGDPVAKSHDGADGEREEIGHSAKVSFVAGIGPGATSRKGVNNPEGERKFEVRP